jgi:hypothetical protein
MIKSFFFGVLALMLLVQAPFIFALDCNSISELNKPTCLEVLNSNLSLEEKESIISNLEYDKIFFPDHNYIYQKNINLQINKAPNGVKTYNLEFVKNAWMSIFTEMPSVIYNDSIYVPNNTQILTGFNYDLIIPQDYSSTGYPNTNNGDCKRTYTLINNYSENKVYVNNNYQGSGRLVDSNINKDSNISSIFNIDVNIGVNHYTWKKYCSRYKRGLCISYSYRCDFNYNEDKRNGLTISDSVNIKYYNNSLVGNVSIIGANNRLRINKSNSFELNTNSSEYSFYDYSYRINYSKAPYYVQNLVAEDYNQEYSNNLQKSNNDLIIKDLNSCKIRAFDFFNVLYQDCSLDKDPINLTLKTNKLTYLSNETIKVSVYPSNIPVNITYGNESKIVFGNSTFKVKEPYNKLTAEYQEFESDKVIFIKDPSKFSIIFSLSLFGFCNYMFYSLLRKYWGGFL